MKNPFLIGKQIYRKFIEEDDIRTCQKWINDPAITRTITSYLPFNKRQERKWLEKGWDNGKYHDIIVMSILRAEWGENVSQ